MSGLFSLFQIAGAKSFNEFLGGGEEIKQRNYSITGMIYLNIVSALLKVQLMILKHRFIKQSVV